MNQLTNQKSPYLLQHKDNPVDWYPWGDEAFERARSEDKPIFLSIGYATCHWCHVMAHESFEDEEVAKLMNQTFVNIKVDREERPDIDNTYMTICQMLNRQGGWPLTIVMTPDKKPFYAATYLPKQSRQNRIGMFDLVPAIEKAWETDRENIYKSVEKIEQGFSKSLQIGHSGEHLPDDLPEQTYQQLSQRYDSKKGGFSTQPKFPSPHNLLFLLNRYRLNNDKNALEMVRLTLKKMRLGGLWDHIGFGFHRYSTDREWLLPHFEKMLYDQAMLLMAYSEAWKVTKEPLFKQTAYEIVMYIDECLKSEEGAFFSAEDADSEGEEGKFYVWSEDEIDSLLNDMEAKLFKKNYNIHGDGNFLDEATQQKTGANIPHLNNPLNADQSEKINPILKNLKRERSKRERPLLDDKILTDWNGLMIAALAKAGTIFTENKFIDRAETAWSVIQDHCLKTDFTLLHRLKDGEAEIQGMADDYAFIIFGLIELYESTFKPQYLKQAIHLQNRFDEDFMDMKFGGYFFTATDAEKLLGRQKEIYDGAIPSSNSVAVLNLLRLSRLTGEPGYEDQITSLFTAFSEQITDAPAGYTFAVHAFQISNSELVEILITVPEWNSSVKKSLEICRNNVPLGSAILVKTPELANKLQDVAPFTQHYKVDDHLMVYVCKDFKCEKPVDTLSELKNLLEGMV